MVGGYNGSALSQADLESPSQTILLFESLGSARALGSSYPTHGLSRVDTRHNTGGNFAFADGHVKWFHPRRTYVSDTDNMWLP
jgi:prepilin-type processing-associated H-X9-DG protein